MISQRQEVVSDVQGIPLTDSAQIQYDILVSSGHFLLFGIDLPHSEVLRGSLELLFRGYLKCSRISGFDPPDIQQRTDRQIQDISAFFPEKYTAVYRLAERVTDLYLFPFLCGPVPLCQFRTF